MDFFQKSPFGFALFKVLLPMPSQFMYEISAVGPSAA